MDTHRYVRRHLVESNKVDRYDLNLRRASNYSASSPAHESITEEYWTNGTTTLLSIPAVTPTPLSNAASSFPTGTPNQFLHPTTQYSSSSMAPPTQSNMSDSPSRPSATRGHRISADSSSPKNVIRNSLMAGSVAGMASTIACHPFDVLRVKMQSTALATTTPVGVTGTFRHTVQYGGVRALYTGLALPLAAQAVYKGTVFTVNNLTQQAVTEWKTQENYKLGIFQPYKITMADRFLCGFMGGAVNAALFVTPVEYVRNQLISSAQPSKGLSSADCKNNHNKTKGPISVIRRTLQSNGMAGLWRGMGSTVLRDSVGCGLFFVTMAVAQEQLTPPDEQPSSSVVISSGALAGVAFWLWALPVDTMKTWIQSGTAKNLRHAYEMSQGQGIPSLFRGWQVAYGRGAPSAAITVTCYSLVYRSLNVQQVE